MTGRGQILLPGKRGDRNAEAEKTADSAQPCRGLGRKNPVLPMNRPRATIALLEQGRRMLAGFGREEHRERQAPQNSGDWPTLETRKPRNAGLSTSIWRGDRDSNPRYSCEYNGFRIRPVRPLRHLPQVGANNTSSNPFGEAPCEDFFTQDQLLARPGSFQQVSRVSASRYLSAVFCATSAGTAGAGGSLFQPVDSSQSRTNCLSKLGGLVPSA